MKELTLFTPPPPAPLPLTPNQQDALEHLQRAGADGLTGTALGQVIHRHERPCLHCHQTGLSLLQALKKKHHARQTRGGIYIALQIDPTSSADTFGDIPY